MKLKNWLKDFSKGMVLGTGILPGVSVGTVGIIVNIYNKLLDSINGLRTNFLKSFKTLLPIALGCIFSAIILLFTQDTLYSFAPFEITCLFAGFVLCGIPVVLHDISLKKPCKTDIFRLVLGSFCAAIIGIASVLAYVYWKLDMTEAFNNPNQHIWIYVVTPLVGFVAAVGCLLPGISGSMIVFIFGLYNPVVELFKGENSIMENPERLPEGIILIVLLFFGVVIGLFATSKVMKNLIERHKKGTYTIVAGFIFGSFISMFVNKDMWIIYPSLTPVHIFIGLAILCSSFVGFYILLRFLYLNKNTPEGK